MEPSNAAYTDSGVRDDLAGTMPDAGHEASEPAPDVSAATSHPEVWSSAADSRGGLGSEGMVTVWDHEGRYVGCMGVELWRSLLTASAGSVRDA